MCSDHLSELGQPLRLLSATFRAPRFQSEHFYETLGYHAFVPGKLNLESRIPRGIGDQLTTLGHRVTMAGDWSNSSAPTVIKITTGVLEGGADPRRGRFIFGR